MLNYKPRLVTFFVACMVAPSLYAQSKAKYQTSYIYQRGLDFYANQDNEQAFDYFQREVKQDAYTFIDLIYQQSSEYYKHEVLPNQFYLIV